MSRVFGSFLGVILLFVVIVGAFITGGLAVKNDAYDQIPGFAYIVHLVDEPFFYPAPAQDESKLAPVTEISYPFSFIVYGDSREIASSAKTAIIERIICEKPAFVLHLGDMVSCSNAHQWHIFDLFEGGIVQAGIPFYPVLGNHEYRSLTERYPVDPEEQLAHYFKRFSFLGNRRWYEFTVGPCTVIVLDTGTDFSEGSAQLEWLQQRLREQVTGYRFIALHYPPYTRSTHGREAEELLSALFESTDPGVHNPDIVFAGHVHNYERYRYGGIQYIVSGGGGAQPLMVKRSSKDFFTQPGATYHYCKVSVTETALSFEMIRLNEGDGTWAVGDSFVIEKSL